MKLFVDRVYRLPRKWSNAELKKFSSFFCGDIVNVSAWKDEDKEGGFYKDYFPYAKSYILTNWDSKARGYQGFKNEIYLDLEHELPSKLNKKFDVVFNHTTLEHVYNFNLAFKNLCDLSNDVVIICVPFIQPYHGTPECGDFWRFTPEAINRLFVNNGFATIYLSANSNFLSSVYVFAIGSSNPEKWLSNKTVNSFMKIIAPNDFSKMNARAIPDIPGSLKKLKNSIRHLLWRNRLE